MVFSNDEATNFVRVHDDKSFVVLLQYIQTRVNLVPDRNRESARRLLKAKAKGARVLVNNLRPRNAAQQVSREADPRADQRAAPKVNPRTDPKHEWSWKGFG